MRAAFFCCAHNPAVPADRRFGTAKQARAAGLLGGRPPAKRHEQLMLPVDGVADGPPTDPRAVLARAPTPDDDQELEGGGKALTLAEIETFLATVHPAWRVFFDLLASTGLRVLKRSRSTSGTCR